MTQLRQDFIRRMEQRGMSPSTIQSYVHGVAACTRFHQKPPLRLTADDIRAYLVHLRQERKLEPITVNLHYYGLKLFFSMLRPESDVMSQVRRMKQPVSVPVILSRSEIDRLMNAAENLRAEALIAVLYSSGLRLAECPLRQGHQVAGDLALEIVHGILFPGHVLEF